MRIPEKKLCDLCHGELTGPHVSVWYPVDDADRALLRASFTGLFGVLALAGMPPRWPFEFCCGCVDGFMPMLAELKTQALQRVIAEHKHLAELEFGKGDPDA